MSPSTVYLLTGANRPRGIGLALTAHILSKHENAFVYATVRDPTKASPLDDLKTKYPDRLAIVKWIAADVEGNVALAKKIEQRHGRVDTVIANAALLNGTGQVHEIDVRSWEDHFQANVLGPAILFQCVYELLKRSSNPRFIPITSIGGSLGEKLIELDMRHTVYASTKATLNWITRKIHFENPWLVTFPLSPGGVDSDMYDHLKAVDATGAVKQMTDQYGQFPTADQAAVLLLKIIDESTREKDGGQFINVDGSRVAW